MITVAVAAVVAALISVAVAAIVAALVSVAVAAVVAALISVAVAAVVAALVSVAVAAIVAALVSAAVAAVVAALISAAIVALVSVTVSLVRLPVAASFPFARLLFVTCSRVVFLVIRPFLVARTRRTFFVATRLVGSVITCIRLVLHHINFRRRLYRGRHATNRFLQRFFLSQLKVADIFRQRLKRRDNDSSFRCLDIVRFRRCIRYRQSIIRHRSRLLRLCR